MAPVASPVNHFLREQIIDNCCFVIDPHTQVELVIAKEPLGTFQAVAAVARRGRREALLSESGATVQDALQMLFVRSAEAVQNHIKTTGFDFCPSEADDDDDADDAFGTASADESLSDNETVSVRAAPRKDRQWKLPLTKTRSSGKQPAPPVKANTRRRRSRSRSPTSTNRSRSRSTSSSGITDDEDEQQQQPHPAAAPWSFPPHHPMRPPMFPGMPPNPMFRPSNAGPPFRMPPGPGAFPFPHASHFPGPSPGFHPPPPAAFPGFPTTRDISLHILVHRPDHPNTPLDRRLLAQAPLMAPAIEEVARNYVRREGNGGGLTAALQKVVLPGGVEYDLSGWRGADLRGLVDGGNAGGGGGGFRILWWVLGRW